MVFINFHYKIELNCAFKPMDDKCQECGQIFSIYTKFCKPCNSVHFRDNFAHWTSGDLNLDKLIQNSQLNAYEPSELIEWIEYSNFENGNNRIHTIFIVIYQATGMKIIRIL